MVFSYNWLKEYFEKDLPSANELVDLINLHSFEIEGVEEKDGDYLIDIDVLPNRVHDALCHYGMAQEISSFANIDLKELKIEKLENLEKSDFKIEVKEDFCRRYIGREIRDVKVEESPEEIRKKLGSIGQRSINNIVDITNLVMFELNQPMHAFDTDKLSGGINVRFADCGENIITLDNNEVELDSEIPVIADDENPLAIAGVKGGKKAEVNNDTVNIILESANFDPVLVRKTSTKTGIKTDSSKRFENEITPELAEKAIDRATELIMKYAATDETKVYKSVDHYPRPVEQKTIKISIEKTNSLLGLKLDSTAIVETLNKLKFENNSDGDSIEVKIPHERLDLNIETDLIEEIGRIYGYEKVEDQEIPNIDFSAKINRGYAINSLIRKTLTEIGFSEIITRSFVSEGVLEPMKPIADDKKYLRSSLKEGINNSLELNQKNADWLGLDHIKVFEIGKVFFGEKENYSEKIVLGIGTINKQGIKKPSAGTFRKEAIEKLSETLGIQINTKDNLENDDVIEIDLEEIYEKVSDDKLQYIEYSELQNQSYTPVSQYPFVLRDIAVWLSNETPSDELVSIIKENAGELLVKEPRLFDEYQKDDKTSYAYRLVFQSHEKTLTDDEINQIMESINKEIESKNWEIR
jgi:phenylalanyl-tRNA synthetase beta chain